MQSGHRRVIIKRIAMTLGILMLGAMFAGAGFLFYCMMTAPSISILDARPQGYRSSVLDDEGNVVLTLSGEESNRVYVTLGEMPEDLQHAFVAIEDERFYEHHGIDPRGIARAFFRGIQSGGFSEGASTITQQLLKNNVFEGWTGEATFYDRLVRKLQEQYLAICLEMHVTKDWILENYMNTINLGGGNWGVETAAKYYFHKDVTALNLSECAVLAGITKNPTRYNPRINKEANASRRELVLSKMKELGFITEDAYNEAMADDVYVRIEQAENEPLDNTEILTYFEDAMIYDVLADIMAVTGCSEEVAWKMIYRGGLTIHSTENSVLQQICEDEANNPDLYSTDAQVSMVVIDTQTGQVKAMVGGRGQKTASLILNRATSEPRQPGSTIKIIGEYAAALDKGEITLGTIFDDAPYTYSDGTEVQNSDGSYGGFTTVRSAIVKSNNIVALKTFQKMGVDAVWNELNNFGISTLTDDDRVEALALGGLTNGVTNLELTAAYGTIARGGTYIRPTYYTKIVDHDGNVIVDKQTESRKVISESTAALLTNAMEDAIWSGTGADAAFEGMDIAGKSGTSTDGVDLWFVGYSPYLTCGVWGGYDDRSGQEESTYVKSVWKTVMSRAHESREYMHLSSEDGLKTVVICKKCGKVAIEGLCDSTQQGDMTVTEFYLPGTEPTEKCDCHVSVKVCDSSGLKANKYCKDTHTEVYLKSATPGTADEEYVLPDYLESGECKEHKSSWSTFWGNGNSGNGSGSGSGSGNGSGGGSSGSNSGSGSNNGSGNGGSGGAGSNNGSGNGSGWDFWGGGSGGDSGNGGSGGSGSSNGSGSSGSGSFSDWWDSLWGSGSAGDSEENRSERGEYDSENGTYWSW